MSLDLYSLFLSIGALVIASSVIVIVVAFLFSDRRRDKIMQIDYERWLIVIGSIAILATITSLIYQFIYKTPVCELCWWQRIFLYPIEVITLVAIWKKTKEAHITVAILAAIGLFFASYHYYYHFQGFVLGNKLTLPCSYGGLLPACTDSPILVFGFITIPFMGILIFVAVLLLAWIAQQKLIKDVKDVTNKKQIMESTKESEIETEGTKVTHGVEEKSVASGSIVISYRQLALIGASLLAFVFIIVAFLFTRGYIVAATVNGTPISRLSIVTELEKQGGKQALEAAIQQQLLQNALQEKDIIIEDRVVDEEMKLIEENVKSQGGTLEAALEQQNMTLDILREQIKSQKGIELAIADKLAVTDEEVASYAKTAGIEKPADMSEVEFSEAIKEQLKQQKFQTEAATWVQSLTDSANITYYISY
jgi:disulfide bond formation protein DsbB